MSPLERAGARYRAAVAARDEARDALAGEVVAALDAGMTEALAAKIAGVTRMTIRAWRNGSVVSSDH